MILRSGGDLLKRNDLNWVYLICSLRRLFSSSGRINARRGFLARLACFSLINSLLTAGYYGTCYESGKFSSAKLQCLSYMVGWRGW
ncbi:hypothetical protein BJX70DRAFT_104928 [Aspergillus crustosus]